MESVETRESRGDIGLLTARETLEGKYEDALVELSSALKRDDSSLIRYWEAYIRDIETSMRALEGIEQILQVSPHARGDSVSRGLE